MIFMMMSVEHKTMMRWECHGVNDSDIINSFFMQILITAIYSSIFLCLVEFKGGGDNNITRVWLSLSW